MLSRISSISWENGNLNVTFKDFHDCDELPASERVNKCTLIFKDECALCAVVPFKRRAVEWHMILLSSGVFALFLPFWSVEANIASSECQEQNEKDTGSQS
jgi:hypothetical protein